MVWIVLSGVYCMVAGDVITALDEHQVVTTGDLVSALDEHSIGDTVALKIRRDAGNGNPGKELQLSLKLQEEVT